LHRSLTSDALAAELATLTGSERLFLRQHQPHCGREHSHLSIAFRASRYGKSLDGTMIT